MGGAISVLLFVWQFFVRLPWALLTRAADWRRFRLVRCGIYLVTALLCFALARFDDRVASDRADSVAQAVKAFHAAQGRYPENLDELVPAHLPAIPVARPLALQQDSFRYRNPPANTDGTRRPPMLMYTALGPFGWSLYDFEKNAWELRD
jgi:hypothetical protein